MHAFVDITQNKAKISSIVNISGFFLNTLGLLGSSCENLLIYT